jgi:hypothetical protein
LKEGMKEGRKEGNSSSNQKIDAVEGDRAAQIIR